MKLLANVMVNLRATGPAAVVIAWIIGMTILGILGKGPEAKSATRSWVLPGSSSWPR